MHLHDYLTSEFIDYSKRFEALRARAIPGFLLRGSAGGALGAFCWGIVLTFVNHGAFDSDFIFTSLLLFLPCGLVGGLAGGFVWIIGRLTYRRIRSLLAGLIGMLFVSFPVALMYASAQIRLRPIDLIPFVLASLIGLPAGLCAASRIRPWSAIAFGMNIRSSDGTSLQHKVKLWSVMGLGLRVVSLLVLMESILAFTVLLFSENQNDLLSILFLIFYSAVTCAVAFASVRLPIAIVEGVFLNAPLLLFFSLQDEQSFFSLLSVVFFGLWLLFILGRICALMALPRSFAPLIPRASLNRAPQLGGS